MIWDCHTHWSTCYQQRDGRDPRRWLEILDRHGVTHAIVLPTAGLFHAGRIPQDNDDVAAICAQAPQRLVPFCTVNTWFAEEARNELHRCLETLRFRGIKFHPWLQGLTASSAEMDQVCETAAAFDVPILFHDGTPPFSLPSQIGLLAQRHPRTQIILGHSGLFEHWREAMAAMRGADNLWACLCSPHLAGLRQLVQHCDPTRLLWGSDHGYSLADLYDYRLNLMRLVGCSENLLADIFEHNPKRLLRWP